MDLKGLLSWDNLVIGVFVIALFLGAGFLISKLLNGDEDEGKAAARKIARKKSVILEVVLAYLNFVEAFIPATLSAGEHTLSFWPRLATHFGIASVGTTFGLGIFFQVEEAVKEEKKYKDHLRSPYIQKDIKREMKRRINKQWRDVYVSVVMAMAAPAFNLLIIAIGLQEVPNLINPHNWQYMSMTLVISSIVTVLHLMMVIYISMTSSDAFLDNLAIPTTPKMPWPNVLAWVKKNAKITEDAMNTFVNSSSSARQAMRTISILANKGALINDLLDNDDLLDINKAQQLEDEYEAIISDLKSKVPVSTGP